MFKIKNKNNEVKYSTVSDGYSDEFINAINSSDLNALLGMKKIYKEKKYCLIFFRFLLIKDDIIELDKFINKTKKILSNPALADTSYDYKEYLEELISSKEMLNLILNKFDIKLENLDMRRANFNLEMIKYIKEINGKCFYENVPLILENALKSCENDIIDFTYKNTSDDIIDRAISNVFFRLIEKDNMEKINNIEYLTSKITGRFFHTDDFLDRVSYTVNSEQFKIIKNVYKYKLDEKVYIFTKNGHIFSVLERCKNEDAINFLMFETNAKDHETFAKFIKKQKEDSLFKKAFDKVKLMEKLKNNLLNSEVVDIQIKNKI